MIRLDDVATSYWREVVGNKKKKDRENLLCCNKMLPPWRLPFCLRRYRYVYLHGHRLLVVSTETTWLTTRLCSLWNREAASFHKQTEQNAASVRAELLELMYRETVKYIYENSHKCRQKNVTSISLIKRDILADKL